MFRSRFCAMTFFYVYHEFQEGAAPGFFEWVASLKPEDWTAVHDKNLSLNMWNHSFAPCGAEGPVFCCWESRNDISVEEFQTFIDGPDGPGAGKVFINKVHKVMEGFPLPYPSKFAGSA